MSHKGRRIIAILILLITCTLFLTQGMARQYMLYANVVAICIVFLVWNQYDIHEPRLSELVLCACMISIAVAGRVLFMWAPAFKPISAIVMLAGCWLGGYNGFLCGSLAAFISDLFFGQGPWTIFQMFAWGCIGSAGACTSLFPFEKRRYRMFFAITAGLFFSLFMDVYTTVSTGDFTLARYIAFLATSMPFTIIYCISNVLFMEVLYPLLAKKMERMKRLYG